MDRPSGVIVDAAREARTGAVWARRPEVRTLTLTGPDRARYLNGQITQDVLILQPGEGTLGVKTSAKGRCEALLRVRVRVDRIDLDLLEVVAEPTRLALERYIIMDDCEVRDSSGDRAVLTVLGPARTAALHRAGVVVAVAPPAHGFVEIGELTVIADRTLGAEGWEVHGAPSRIESLAESLRAAGVIEAPAEALEIIRVEEGVPVDGRELDADTIPLEAHLEHAISMTKGCYSGQEVIARATNLGGVNWSLVGLVAEDAEALTPDAPLLLEGSDKPQGQATSTAWSPRLERWVALGFVRKSHEAPGSRLWSAGRAVTVTGLPFSP